MLLFVVEFCRVCLKTPVLLMQGDRDEVIDIAHSDNLFANIPAQKKYYVSRTASIYK